MSEMTPISTEICALEDHQVPRADSTSRDKGPRGGCNTLVGWCRKTVSGEGTMKIPHRRQFLHLAAGAAALPAISRIALAQSYPTRPITIIVPFPAGAG